MSTVKTSEIISGSWPDECTLLIQQTSSPSSWKSNANLKVLSPPICL
jgi:hypothetical protein